MGLRRVGCLLPYKVEIDAKRNIAVTHREYGTVMAGRLERRPSSTTLEKMAWNGEVCESDDGSIQLWLYNDDCEPTNGRNRSCNAHWKAYAERLALLARLRWTINGTLRETIYRGTTSAEGWAERNE